MLPMLPRVPSVIAFARHRLSAGKEKRGSLSRGGSLCTYASPFPLRISAGRCSPSMASRWRWAALHQDEAEAATRLSAHLGRRYWVWKVYVALLCAWSATTGATARLCDARHSRAFQFVLTPRLVVATHADDGGAHSARVVHWPAAGNGRLSTPETYGEQICRSTEPPRRRNPNAT